ncbi:MULTISPECIES: prephenate dehydrogenase [Myroides]|uniref:Prephenate dehydrogenase n=1 Tax=Myroides albus TaxID=2562892 RepID=A0A6I3LE41_9FLAO|nr:MULTISPECIES: prephenate dehydrogenase [Myroides]MTG96758.1 prephenate dehydrogenase [Myroides albus]MVX35601.1 prephenate dehydrogenase [Myroides sp. LoEW2-1]UVD80831.1 prephenate dehydrogenase [Myroides albus]
MAKVIGLVGVGLIGGSMVLDLKEKGFASKIIGSDLSDTNLKKALELKIIDEAVDLDNLISRSDIIVLATPVNATVELVPYVLDRISEDKFVLDVGSTKSMLSDAVANHANRGNFVATHPMSGTEFSGPEAAFKGLFKDRVAIICDPEKSNPKALNVISEMYYHLDMRLILMDAHSHDEHVGYVSHLSHAISYALAVAVLDKEKDDTAIFNLAAGGFASTVRLAKSSVDMWLPIFEQNADHILPILDIYLDKLSSFRNYLEQRDTEQLGKFIKEANRIKDKLKK